jgi:flagellar protein FlgJ
MNFSIAGTAAAAQTTPTTAAAALQHRKLTEAAQQFEGMLLQEMLKPMKEHGFCQEDAEDDDGKEGNSGFGDTLSSFGTETMATAIAKGGGLGIAKRVVEQVEGEKAAHDSRVQAATNPTKFQNKTATVLKSPERPPMN